MSGGRRRAAALLGFCLSAGAVVGQAPGHGGRIEGRVRDAAGAAITGAEITARGSDGEVASSARTGEGGAFWLPAMLPGRYGVEAAAAGYAGSLMEDVDLEAGETLRLDFVLAAGGERSFTITAAPTLDTVSAVVPPALGPVDTQKLPLASAGRWAATAGGAGVEPPAGLGLERTRLHGAPAASFRLRLAGLEAGGLLEDALLFDHGELYFDELQVRDLEATAARGGALGGWIDAVPRWPGPAWRGRARIGWASEEPLWLPVTRGGEARALPTSLQVAGDGPDVGVAGGGPLAGRRAWLFLGGSRAESEPMRDAGISREQVRDSALARAAWSPASAGPLRLEGEVFEARGRRPLALGALTAPAGSAVLDESRSSARVARLGLDRVWRFATLRAEAGSSRGDEEPALAAPREAALFLELERGRDSFGLTASRLWGGRVEHVLEVGARHAVEDAVWRSVGLPAAENETAVAWVEDRWRLGRRGTLTLGLRAERQRASVGSTDGAGAGVGDVDLGTHVDPNLGAALDVYGDGTWKLYALLSRARAPVDPRLLLPSAWPLRVDPEASSPSVLAAALGSEQLVVAGVVLSGRVGYWRGSEPLLRLLRFEEGEPFVLLGNPARGLDAPAADELSPGLETEVEILQLALSARLSFGEDWELGGGYSWSRVDGALDLQLLGEGAACGLAALCRPTSGQGFPSALERPHTLELHGWHRFATGLWGAFVFGAAEGTPFVPLREAAPSSWLGAARLVPDPAAAGADARNDAHVQLDLSAGWEVPIGERPYRLALELSAFNVFDERQTIERWPFSGGALLELGDPVLVQEGRWLRFDVRLEF